VTNNKQTVGGRTYHGVVIQVVVVVIVVSVVIVVVIIIHAVNDVDNNLQRKR